jgi:5-deoxy-glucuronate isomerase
VLPLSGGLTIEVARTSTPAVTEARHALTGRRSVFERVTDFAYVGRDSVIRMISAHGAEVAIPSARCEHRLPPLYGPAADVRVDVRGAGPSTRQVTNFGVPGVWEHAERLMACELITLPATGPATRRTSTTSRRAARWPTRRSTSSGSRGRTGSPRAARGSACTPPTPGRITSAAGLDEVAEALVRPDGDVFVVPYGYHGPCIAAPGYPMYYLNVLAGGGEQRVDGLLRRPGARMVRDSWRGQPPDPRCPVTSAAGITHGHTEPGL